MKKEKKKTLLRPRDACKNAIPRALLHIAKPADTRMAPTPPPPTPLLSVCADVCAFGPDASFFSSSSAPAPLCCFRHTYNEGAQGGGDTCLDFLLSVCAQQCSLLFFQNPILTVHHTIPGRGG